MQKKKKEEKIIMNKKKETKKLIKKIYIIILILTTIIIILLIIDFLPKENLNPLKEPELYVIKDECSVVLSSIIHQIKNEGECRIRCRNECEIRGKEIDNIEFTEQISDCNICNCYCK